MSTGYNAAWQLQRLKKALHVHAGQKFLRLAAEANQKTANRRSRSNRQRAAGSRVSSKGRLKGRLKGRPKGNCNRQNVKGTRAESLSKKGRHTCNREGGSGKTTLPMRPLLHPLVLHHLHTQFTTDKGTVDLIC